MKKSLALIAAALAFISPAAKADYVDSVMTFTLKFHFNEKEWETKGAFSVLNMTTSSLKTADFIAAYAAANGQQFSKKAQIIWRDEYESDATHIGYKIYIRDPGKSDVDVSALFDENTDEGGFASKGKYNDELGTGTFSQIYTSVLTFRAHETTPDASSVEATGINNFNLKTVKVKETGSFVDLGTVSGKIFGKAYFMDAKRQRRFEGVVDGTFKLSGPKVVKIAPK